MGDEWVGLHFTPKCFPCSDSDGLYDLSVMLTTAVSDHTCLPTPTTHECSHPGSKERPDSVLFFKAMATRIKMASPLTEFSTASRSSPKRVCAPSRLLARRLIVFNS